MIAQIADYFYIARRQNFNLGDIQLTSTIPETLRIM